MNSLLAVFIGGGLGSLCRYGVSRLTLSFFHGSFPVATLISNLTSTLLLSLILAFWGPKSGQDSFWYLLLTVGFCGGFSTFSTFGLETFMLMKSAQYGWALLNVICSVLAALFLFFILLKNS
jgi:CrcB protein